MFAIDVCKNAIPRFLYLLRLQRFFGGHRRATPPAVLRPVVHLTQNAAVARDLAAGAAEQLLRRIDVSPTRLAATATTHCFVAKLFRRRVLADALVVWNDELASCSKRCRQITGELQACYQQNVHRHQHRLLHQLLQSYHFQHQSSPLHWPRASSIMVH